MSDKDSEYFTVVFMGDLKALEGNPFWYRSDFGTPISIATGHALETLDDMRDVAQQAGKPSREAIARVICCGDKCILEGTNAKCLALNEECGEGDKADAILALYAAPVSEGMRGMELTENMLKAGAQALADDVWHPPQKFDSLPKHDQNKFTRQALIVLKAVTSLPSTNRGDAA